MRTTPLTPLINRVEKEIDKVNKTAGDMLEEIKAALVQITSHVDRLEAVPEHLRTDDQNKALIRFKETITKNKSKLAEITERYTANMADTAIKKAKRKP